MKAADEMIAKLLAGDASQEEVARLVAAAKEDPALLAQLRRQIDLDGMMGVALEDEFTQARRHQKILVAIQNAEREDFVGSVQGRVKRGQWTKRALALAALVALSVTGWFLMPGVAVATVARLETVSSESPLREGATIRKGERLKVTAGLVELQVGNRGKMVVEGPADLEFASAERSILRQGRVVMRVTPAGHGYRVETPEGAVVDLGTEFGVSVGADGKTETHVLEGEVEAIPNGGSKVLLKRDDALRFDSKGSERIPADGGAFYTALPPLRGKGPNYVHWALDEGAGETAHVTERGMATGSKDLRLHAMDEGATPQWSEGVFKDALSFDGKGGYAESNFRGIGEGDPRTVCFWVKVPKDFSTREGFAILSWGRYRADRPGEVWQIAVNPLASDGPVGRIRLGTHEGRIVGTADLRDDKWHHVAIVLYGGSQPNVGTHVLVYLDGKLEPISRRALREVKTEIDKAEHGVWLGRNITYNQSHPNHQHGGFFRGSIDEPYIFDGALSQEDVRELMNQNLAPQ